MVVCLVFLCCLFGLVVGCVVVVYFDCVWLRLGFVVSCSGEFVGLICLVFLPLGGFVWFVCCVVWARLAVVYVCMGLLVFAYVGAGLIVLVCFVLCVVLAFDCVWFVLG